MAPNLDICDVTMLSVVSETAYPVDKTVSERCKSANCPYCSGHLDRGYTAKPGQPGHCASNVRISALRVLFRRLGSGDGIFGYLNLYLIGDFQYECLFFHPGDNTVNP